jgi:hypothetical protein
MTRFPAALLATLIAILSPPALAAPAFKLGDLTSQGATPMTKAELAALLAGATVGNVNTQGTSRSWRQAKDGTLVASSDNRSNNPMAQPSNARGTWRVVDPGKYCVNIEWRTHTEQWCRFIYKLGDDYYGVVTNDDPDAMTSRFKFGK